MDGGRVTLTHPLYNRFGRYWIVTFIFWVTPYNLSEGGSGGPMRIPPSGYLTLALLCGELICVMIWAFTGAFFVLAVGIVAGVGCVISAVRWKD